MSVAMSLLAMLEERPMYGLELKNEFESRTGWVWPVNVGQVYSTLGRLERDGLVAAGQGGDQQKVYELTALGRERLDAWFSRPADPRAGERDELVLKLVLAVQRGPDRARAVIQMERRGGLEELQRYTRLKRDVANDADLGWTFLLDSLIFRAEARIRWLDACEGRLAAAQARGPVAPRPAVEPAIVRSRLTSEVSP